mmetsp:Transcript_40379/g.72521  ORF Transcript_40379/g.72521 Transcript_40379/m.72521 type:complete len:135 (-) Transcript_40379:44-448(-)
MDEAQSQALPVTSAKALSQICGKSIRPTRTSDEWLLVVNPEEAKKRGISPAEEPKDVEQSKDEAPKVDSRPLSVEKEILNQEQQPDANFAIEPLKEMADEQDGYNSASPLPLVEDPATEDTRCWMFGCGEKSRC